MGSEASKPVQPPDDWEPKGARREFEIISPVSDISNPSEMKGARHNRIRQQRLHQPNQPTGPGGNESSKRTGGKDNVQKRLDERYDQDHPQQHKNEKKKLHGNQHQHSFKNSQSNNRRVSRTVTAELPPNVMKGGGIHSGKTQQDRKSTSSSSTDLPPPSSFYFPSNDENQNSVGNNRLKTATGAGGSRKSKFFVDQQQQPQQPQQPHLNLQSSSNDQKEKQRQNAKSSKRGIIKKTIKKTQKVMMACLDDSTQVDENAQQQQQQQLPQLQKQNTVGSEQRRQSETVQEVPSKARHHPTLGVVVAKMPSSKNLPAGKATRKKSIETDDVTKDTNPIKDHQNESEDQHTDNYNIDSIALHHEEAYFERLSLSEEGSIEASPFGRQGSSNRVSAILEKDSGIRGLLGSAVVEKTSEEEVESVSSAVSDLFNTTNSIPDRMKSNLANLPPTSNNVGNVSPAVSSLLRFYSATGPMEVSPEVSYHSELDNDLEVENEKSSTQLGESEPSVVDEKEHISQNHVSSSNEVLAIVKKRESGESQSSLYTNEGCEGTDNQRSTQALLKENMVDHGKKVDAIATHFQQSKLQVCFPTSYHKNAVKSKGKDPFRKQKKDLNKSKLESLFRPVLQTLSNDDALSASSFNPHEIKVTESAPGALTSVGCHIGLAPRMERSSSTMSMDTQKEVSSNFAKKLVSTQAEYNGEFLFSEEGKMIVCHPADKARDNSSVSISTAGSRSRLTQRSTRDMPVALPPQKKMIGYLDARQSNGSYKSGRRVRFSVATIEDDEKRRLSKSLSNGEADIRVPTTTPSFPNIEHTVSDLTDTAEENTGQRSTDINSFRSSISSNTLSDEHTRIPSPVNSHSSVFRSTGAKISNGSQEALGIKSKFSDLTEDTSIWNGSSRNSMPTPVPEEDDSMTMSSSQDSVHWVVSDNGVTPYAKGRSAKKPTKSPLKRFKQAKKSFALDTRDMSVVVKKPTSSAGGLVAARVEELNTRVKEVRKIKRMRKKLTNPRLHTHKFDNKQPVRSRALIAYKTQFDSADVEKSNAFMAAKFNVIPDPIDDDEDDVSDMPSPASFPSIKQAFAHDENSDIESTEEQGNKFLPAKYVESDEDVKNDEDEEDEASKLSDGTMSVSVATVRQERTGPRPRMYSESTSLSTSSGSSSGFSNIRRQGSRLFRESVGATSILSSGNSTTLTAAIQKENAPTFRAAPTSSVKPSQQNVHAPPSTLFLSPTQRTPSQAMKWRTLAAAAQKKDAEALSSKHPRRGLGLRSSSRQNVKAPY